MARSKRARRRPRRNSFPVISGALLLGFPLFFFLLSVLILLWSIAWQWLVAVCILGSSLLGLGLWGVIGFLRRRRQQQLLLTDALELSPQAFETRIANLLRNLGWERVTQVGGRGDGGVDLRGRFQGQQCIVQCKRYQGRVEPKYIRDLEGARSHEQADRAYLITTGYFTKQGYQWVVGKPIELWDAAVLAERFQEQQHRLQDPVRKRIIRQRHYRMLGSLAGVNLLLILWSSLTAPATPMASRTTFQQTIPEQSRMMTSVPATPTVTVTATPATCGQATIVGVERLVLRDAPGLETTHLADYPAGTRVTLHCAGTITRDSIVWQSVRVDDIDGWMSRRFLEERNP